MISCFCLYICIYEVLVVGVLGRGWTDIPEEITESGNDTSFSYREYNINHDHYLKRSRYRSPLSLFMSLPPFLPPCISSFSLACSVGSSSSIALLYFTHSIRITCEHMCFILRTLIYLFSPTLITLSFIDLPIPSSLDALTIHYSRNQNSGPLKTLRSKNYCYPLSQTCVQNLTILERQNCIDLSKTVGTISQQVRC